MERRNFLSGLASLPSFRDGQASPKTCVDLSKDFTGDEKGDFFPTGPAHQHDDCRAADIATSAHAEPAVPPNQLLEMLESSW